MVELAEHLDKAVGYKFFHSLSFLSFCCVFNFIISNFVVYNSFLFLILVTVTDITLT